MHLVFMEKHEEMLEEYIDHMPAAFNKWNNLDNTRTKDDESAIVTAFSCGALDYLLLAIKIFISGQFIASDNA
jgi:hypothetical protein